jgi:hypothetical protein
MSDYIKKLYIVLTPKIAVRVRVTDNLSYPDFMYRVTTEIGRKRWGTWKWEVKFSFSTKELSEALSMWKNCVEAVDNTRKELP